MAAKKRIRRPHFLNCCVCDNSQLNLFSEIDGKIYWQCKYCLVIFLDNELDEEKIKAQLMKLADVSERKGIAIGIGHVKPQTLNVLAREIPILQEKGFRFEFVSRLVY